MFPSITGPGEVGGGCEDIEEFLHIIIPGNLPVLVADVGLYPLHGEDPGGYHHRV